MGTICRASITAERDGYFLVRRASRRSVMGTICRASITAERDEYFLVRRASRRSVMATICPASITAERDEYNLSRRASRRSGGLLAALAGNLADRAGRLCSAATLGRLCSAGRATAFLDTHGKLAGLYLRFVKCDQSIELRLDLGRNLRQEMEIQCTSVEQGFDLQQRRLISLLCQPTDATGMGLVSQLCKCPHSSWSAGVILRSTLPSAASSVAESAQRARPKTEPTSRPRAERHTTRSERCNSKDSGARKRPTCPMVSRRSKTNSCEKTVELGGVASIRAHLTEKSLSAE